MPASESLITERMPYVHWLSTRHEPDDEFYPLAHLVLSGGPDGIWAGRFDLSPSMVYSDIQLYYAGERAKITAEHLDLADKARDEYWNNAPTVATAIHHRLARDNRGVKSDFKYDSRGIGAGAKEIDRALGGPFDDEGLQPPRDLDDAVPQVTDFNGDDVSVRDKLPVLRLRSRCVHVRETGRQCTRTTEAGNEFCTHHGGRIYTDAELRSIHRITKEKLLAAGEAAVDNLLELLNSTNDMVRLKASEAILDRTGFTPGVEVTLVNTTDGMRAPSEIIAERLSRLANNIQVTQIHPGDEEPDAVDAEVVEDGVSAESSVEFSVESADPDSEGGPE